MQVPYTVSVQDEAPLQVGASAGEIAFETPAHHVLTVGDAVGVEHFGCVLVQRCGSLLPRANFANATPRLALVDHDSIVGEQGHDAVDVETGVGLEVSSDDV